MSYPIDDLNLTTMDHYVVENSFNQSNDLEFDSITITFNIEKTFQSCCCFLTKNAKKNFNYNKQ